MKTRYYIVDKLTYDRGAKICKVLRATIPDMKYCSFDEGRGVVEITSKKDYRKQLELACDVAGCVFRTEFRR